MGPADLDVCGVGSALVDVLVETGAEVVAAAGLHKGSMQLMSLEDSERLHARVGGGVERSGGSVANTIAGLASLGARAGFIGRVAADRLGRVFVADMAALGVVLGEGLVEGQVEGLVEPAAAGATGRSLILVTPDADRTMCTTLGVAATLGPDDLDLGLIRRSRLTYLEGYLWDEPQAKEAFAVAIDAAHDAGRLVALSMSDPFCVDRHREAFARMVRDDLDVLFGNADELCSLTEAADLPEACRRVRRPGLTVTVTRGPLGAWAFVGDGPIADAPAPAGIEVVDTTGAGDLYAAGFLWGLTRGQDLETCIRLGNLAAAEVISHVGARPEVSLAGLVTGLGCPPAGGTPA